MGDVNTSYVSDHTTWMNEQLAKNPQWVEDQKLVAHCGGIKSRMWTPACAMPIQKLRRSLTHTTSIFTANNCR